MCQSLGQPDGDVFVVPVLRPFIRFQPSARHLTTRDGLEMCLHPPWTRQRFQEELDKLIAANDSALSPTSGQWTSIAFQIRDSEDETKSSQSTSTRGEKHGDSTSTENKPDLQTEQVRAYLQMLARSRTYSMKVRSGTTTSKSELNHTIEGSLKLAQQIKFPRQDIPGLPTATLPSWYSTLRDTQELRGGIVSESAAIRSVSALGQVYGLSIMDQSAASPSSSDITADHAAGILRSDESKIIEAACTGEWGSETCLDPKLTDTSLLVTKLNALQVPPLPPKLAEDRTAAQRVGAPPRPAAQGGATSQSEWKPKIDTMVASSRCTPGLGHTAPVVRLVVSQDQRFFVSGSHDGTCRVWELDKAEKCNGILESSITYSGHSSGESSPRVNDLAMIEGGHSVVSGASDGSVHVWRVDMVSSSTPQSSSPSDVREVSRVVGSSEIRKTDPGEGEILAVNHFNTSAASILTFATQKGKIHSWDMRCANEPFLLKNPQDTGYITSMAMGSDRHWVVTGSSRGFIALWDLRFQQVLKLWRHSRAAPVHRLATSFVPPPQSWVVKGANSEARPFLFAACGPNECAMFDVTSGSCRECFRTVDYGSRFSSSRLDGIPRLDEIPLSSSARRKTLASQGLGSRLGDIISSSFRSVNAMVGSIGASDHSFLITGGSDCRIRHWDFAVPSKCYVSSGLESAHPRPTFERIDCDQACRLMLCRQPPNPTLGEVDSSRVPRKLFQGLKKPENSHQDSIQDLKLVKSGLLSCSRDCTVKLWR